METKIYKETWASFMDDVKSTKGNLKEEERASSLGSRRFTQTENYEQAIELAKFGWDKHSEYVKKKKQEFAKQLESYKEEITFHYDVSGDEPDVGRFLAGEPENMVQFEVEKKSSFNGELNIYLNCTYNCMTSQEQILNRGIAMAVFIEKMEDLKIKTNLILYVLTKDRSKKDLLLVDLKKANQILDLDRLVFVSAHPSFLRRLFIRYSENNYNSKTYAVRGGYGYALESLSECESGIELDDNSIEFNQSNLTGKLEDDLNHLSNILIEYAEKMK